ncbi:sulfatase-like hydrolase/transferase [Heliomarina baculiformis]|uniref:sulfatase-like hydrolase/transferase n=1 Tax=Heliomarina baculiformis TaxID=2872036 RepID=UPI001EE1DC33
MTPPEGSPNVLVILIDDLGYGQPGTFGEPVPTPVMDALAEDGLRFTPFHTTAICLPTRAGHFGDPVGHGRAYRIQPWSMGFLCRRTVFRRAARIGRKQIGWLWILGWRAFST